jgi:ABC-2 type transport system permease protein
MNEVLLLLWPKAKSIGNRLKYRRPHDLIRPVVMGILAVLFWVIIFFLFYKVLAYFKSIEILGELLLTKLMAVVFLTFFLMLVISNIITSLSTYFLSEDNKLILTVPVSTEKVYLSKYLITLGHSSWMVLLFGIPVFMAYGTVYGASASYYLWLSVTLLVFLLTPGGIGVMISTALVNVVPAKRARGALVVMFILLLAALYLFFRFLQPEKLVNTEGFSELVDYLAMMRLPTSPFLPSHWATRSLFPLLKGRFDDSMFYFLLLLSTGLMSVLAGSWICRLLYYRGWSRSYESREAKVKRTPLLEGLFDFLLRPLHGSTKAMMIKDVKVFLRDTRQWSQLILLFALVVVYLFNFKALPLNKVPGISFYLENIISFLNVGLAGFVLSAVAVRFIYPAISLEGKSFWVIMSAPIELRRLIWSKFWTSLVPLLLLAEALIVLSNTFLHVTQFMMIISTVTIFLITIAIVSIGIGIGAVYPRFRVEDVAQIHSGFGGLIYMIICVTFIVLVIFLEAWPTYLIFMARTRKYFLSYLQWIEVIFCFCLTVSIILAAIFIPIKIGLKRLSRIEI